VLNQKLGGVMFWDYNSDPSGALLDAINAGLNKNSGAQIGAK
jgi:chitinase